MNIIFHELKTNLKAFIIWTVALSLLFYAASFEYEAFATNDLINQYLDSFEPFFRALAGMTVDINTPEGYLSLISLYIYLPLAIYSGLLGSNIISKEERDKTAEYLFTLPVKRSKVIFSKLVTTIFYSILINVLVLIVTYYSFGRLGTNEIYDSFILNIGIGTFIIQMIFMSLGMGLSSTLKHYKKSGGITIGILMGTFMLHILIGLTDKIDFLKYITPFKYFGTDLMIEGEFKLVFILLSILLIGTGMFSLFYFYRKRDLYI